MNQEVESKMLVNERHAAEIMGISVKTAQGWRFKGDGPRFVKIGKKAIRYQICDIFEWIDQQRRQSTSDSGTNAGRDCNLLSPWGEE